MNDVKAHIRNMLPTDSTVVKALMKTFYASNAVHSNGSNAVFDADFNACVSDSPYLDGFVFEADEQVIGYSMIAKSFATDKTSILSIFFSSVRGIVSKTTNLVIGEFLILSIAGPDNTA